MNRETFRELLRPLSPKEQRLKAGEDVDKEFFQKLNFLKLYDENGYYYFTNELTSKLVREDDFLRTNISLRNMQNKLRLIIHLRYSKDPLHYDEFIGINYVYSGHLKIQFPDESITLSKGQLCLMGTNVVHSYQIEGEDDLILSFQMEKKFLTKNFLYGLSNNGPIVDFLMSSIFGTQSIFTYSIFDCNQDDKMQLLFEDLFCEYSTPSLCSNTLVENYIKTFFILLIRSSYTSKSTNSKANISQILKYIEDNSKNCTLEKLSKEFNFNPKYISRLIKDTTGSSFSEILTNTRINDICYYLRNSSISIQDAAIECGYTNLNFFYKKFKEIYHISPKEYREKYSE